MIESFLEQLRIEAHEDAKNLNLRGGNFTHFFSRLSDILSTVGKKNVRKNFSTQIKAESKDGSIFQDHLKKFELVGQKL